ncbi:MAG: CvpA family protein [Actinomycetota bacterium]|nr:CvpA family protein [Actinomycetota bacterium]
MTALDWIIVAITLLMAFWGYFQGLLAGALALLGFGAGALIGSRIGPLLLEEGSRSPFAPLAALMGALLIGGLLASGLELLGFQLRRRLGERLGLLDGAGGAVLVAGLGLFLTWIVGAVALQVPGGGDLREPIQKSVILRQLNATLPPSGPLLNSLARFDPFPRIAGPTVDVRSPDSAIARDPQVRAAGRSVVKVLGTACGLGVQGSGWIAGDGIVVTNAHVVGGQDDTTVQVEGKGATHDADAIWFDERNDLAILRASGVSGVRALKLNEGAKAGTSAAILGFPGNGPYDVQPGRLAATQDAFIQDASGGGRVQRRITGVRGLVRSGNSGGPAVDGRGRVVTTLFAATVRGDSPGAFGVPDAIVREALGRAGDTVDTGPCVD